MFLSLEDCAAVVSFCLSSRCSAWALQVFAYCGRLISQGVYSELLVRPDKCWWLVVGPVFVARVCDESFRKCKRTGMGKGTGTGTGTGEGTDTCPGMGKGTGTGPGTVKGSLKCSGIGKRVDQGMSKGIAMIVEGWIQGWRELKEFAC